MPLSTNSVTVSSVTRNSSATSRRVIHLEGCGATGSDGVQRKDSWRAISALLMLMPIREGSYRQSLLSPGPTHPSRPRGPEGRDQPTGHQRHQSIAYSSLLESGRLSKIGQSG